MQPGKLISFAEFEMDAANQCVWRGRRRIDLRPKTFAVLRYLVERPGMLVSKQELLEALWPGTFVTEEVLKGCIREIRAALGDDAATPRLTETKHRVGYRFIAEVRIADAAVADRPPLLVVEREDSLERLHQWLRSAGSGQTQTVFITGEPGIGKSTLVEAFLQSAPARQGGDEIRMACGRCFELHGSGEPYLPVFEGLEQISASPAREKLRSVLEQYAPTWLVQMPGLIPAEQRRALAKETLGATRERMIREMATALEVFAAEALLVLVLEDLHWSDAATVDLISALARRPRIRLMLVGTYRPVEVVITGHPLRAVKQDLELKGLCHELALDLLSEEGVARYLELRFGAGSVSPEAIRAIHRRTEGNPLFVVSLVDHVQERKGMPTLARPAAPDSGEPDDLTVPETLRQLVESDFERLEPNEQAAAEVASIAGPEFCSLVLARSLEMAPEQAEQVCERLARGSYFVERAGMREFPNGEVSAQYRFRHSLYQEVLHARIPVSRRVQLHQRVGECLEQIYGARSGEIAAELAAHFEQSRDFLRATRHTCVSAEKAARRFANTEAAKLLEAALGVVERIPEPARTDLELAVREQLGHIYRSAGDMAKSGEQFEARAARARRAGRPAEEVRSLIHAASTIAFVCRERCLALAAEAAAAGRELGDDPVRAYAEGNAAFWNFMLVGWSEEGVGACARAVESAKRSGDLPLFGLFASRLAWMEALRSRYREACVAAEEGVRLSLETGNAFLLQAGCLSWAWALVHGGQWGRAVRILQEGLTMAEKNGHGRWAQFFRTTEAFLHLHACDFAGAAELSAAVLAWERETPEPFVREIALVVRGVAEAHLRHRDEARQHLYEVRRWQERERLTMDWIWQMPLQLGFVEFALGEGDLALARREARRFIEVTDRTAEKTWRALARDAASRAAMAAGEMEEAAERLSEARALLDSQRMPLAEWRVYASFARLAVLRGEADQARRYGARSRASLRRLAASLEGVAELRQSLLRAASEAQAAGALG